MKSEERDILPERSETSNSWRNASRAARGIQCKNMELHAE